MTAVGRGYTYDVPPSATGAPSRLTVATCQMPVGRRIAENASHLAALFRAAAVAGADLVHFPECALSGYGAAAWPAWDGLDWDELAEAEADVRALAGRLGVWAAYGSVDRPGPGAGVTNCLRLVDRRGIEIARYAKRRLSRNDRRAFSAGAADGLAEIDGVRCGLLICLEWSFPELWASYAEASVELVLLSAHDGGGRRDRNHAHTIPALMQGYAFLHGFAVSLANAAAIGQSVPSLWVERSGHQGRRCERGGAAGFVLNALADDPAQDAFFAEVRAFRAAERVRGIETGGG